MVKQAALLKADRQRYSGFDLKQLHCFKSAGAARIRAMRGNPL
jgi:hypothetical protein